MSPPPGDYNMNFFYYQLVLRYAGGPIMEILPRGIESGAGRLAEVPAHWPPTFRDASISSIAPFNCSGVANP